MKFVANILNPYQTFFIFNESYILKNENPLQLSLSFCFSNNWFFPIQTKRKSCFRKWCFRANGYSSKYAFDEVQRFLKENPNFSPILKRKLLQATDGLYRAQNIKKETE